MSYGQQVFPGPPASPPGYGGQTKKSNVMAVAGLVLALLGVLGSFIPFANMFFAFLALLGLIFAVIGLVTSGSKGAGKGMSIAAIILAVLALVVSIVVTTVAARWVGTKARDFETAQKSAAPVTGTIGQPVKDGRLTFVVKSVKCGVKTYRGSLPAKTLGEFCLVDVSVSNHGDSAQTFADIKVEGFVAASRYEANPEATLKADTTPGLDAAPKAAPNAAGSSKRVCPCINPGSVVQTVVLIDVPVGQRLDRVELHDFIFSDGTSVSVP